MALTTEQLNRKAAEFRANPTYTEQVAITALNSVMPQRAYNFQKVFAFFILDFFFPAKCLVVEIDGDSHKETGFYDFNRDKFINECGLRVLRIPATEASTIADRVRAYPDDQNHEQRNKRAFAIAKQRRDQYDSKIPNSAERKKVVAAYAKKNFIRRGSKSEFLK